jgi:hypothetical protein
MLSARIAVWSSKSIMYDDVRRHTWVTLVGFETRRSERFFKSDRDKDQEGRFIREAVEKWKSRMWGKEGGYTTRKISGTGAIELGGLGMIVAAYRESSGSE